MAYKRFTRASKYFGRARTYGGRARSYGNRAANKMGLTLSMEYLAGVAVGLSTFDNQVPAALKLGVAVVPIKGLGKIKGFAQGMVLGDVIQNLTGFTLGGGSASSNINAGGL